ncbi:hypothetical protein [Parasitella parasitica]|uniref:Uncharacterized protein n=1 Tax=Parasitella parasitica TaxID=35722 RepID=A0A0B7NPF7_9FUNG|nr:hypothetical protein [Parasitella parasitica]
MDAQETLLGLPTTLVVNSTTGTNGFYTDSVRRPDEAVANSPENVGLIVGCALGTLMFIFLIVAAYITVKLRQKKGQESRIDVEEDIHDWKSTEPKYLHSKVSHEYVQQNNGNITDALSTLDPHSAFSRAVKKASEIPDSPTLTKKNGTPPCFLFAISIVRDYPWYPLIEERILFSNNHLFQEKQELTCEEHRRNGYSSFATAIISIIVYWYRKQLTYQKQRLSTSKDSTALDDDELHINPRKRLYIATTDNNATLMMKRSVSTSADLSHQKRQMFTPPSSPLSLSSPTYSDSTSRSASPLGSWSARLLDGVITNIRGKKKLTISMKNTILWNPSKDVNNPNHAFYENTVSLLFKLAQVYDIYVIIHMNSNEERHQIHQLFVNANLLNPLVIDESKFLWCSSEQGKLHMINHISPSIHVEGGWENDNGSNIIYNLRVEHMIWIGHQQKSVPSDINRSNIETADQILCTSIAKQVGFC